MSDPLADTATAIELSESVMQQTLAVITEDATLGLELADGLVHRAVRLRVTAAQAVLGMLLAERPEIVRLVISGTVNKEVQGWVDADGTLMAHPALDPTLPINVAELEWWENVDRAVRLTSVLPSSLD